MGYKSRGQSAVGSAWPRLASTGYWRAVSLPERSPVSQGLA